MVKSFLYKNKKGLSTIIITLILILVSLVAIGIFWVVINNLIKSGTEGIGLGRLTLNAEIKSVSIDNSSNNVTLTVERKVGAGEMTGIKFIFYSDTDTEIITEDIELEQLKEAQFTFHLLMNVGDITKISIAPIFSSSEGEESVGNVLDTYNVEEQPPVPPCVPAINPCGTRVCGSVTNGTCGSISCGTCTGGQECNSTGQCSTPCVPSSCGLLGYECGGPYNNGTCFGTFSCGGCMGEDVCIAGHCQLNITPILWYKFDGNLLDSGVAPAMDGAWTNGTGTFVTGFSGQAADFAGVNGITGNVGSKIGNLSQMTISVYAKKNVASQGGDLFYKHVQYRIIISQNYVTGQIYIGGNVTEVAGIANIDNTNWHQYTLNYNGTALKIYVDGTEIDSEIATGNVDDSQWQELLIGNQPIAWSGTYFNGQVDEFKIYNRSITS
ncbi:MAG: LamG domain-containing protein [Candidatus Nanoarchaeia archaeon]|nr:LamG domain-containing protein [Candidatus Nanoarchaeia archaeon]MDD5357696.1 LamG domain-containing protein [Candidatus Nanoarchaeia archaeon]MDD5588615.1 LamG domain-containing protein [Candidatus Nanoarchaeia archaeon]